MATQAIASLLVVAVFGGIFMIVTVVRNKFMENMNPKDCKGKEEGLCASCPSICDSYRDDLYKQAIDEISGANKKKDI